MFHMFSWCESLHSSGLSGFDISRATTLEQRFYGTEDMDSPQGTALNGMGLFSSNRLRSEDEISIGETVLRVLF